MKATVFSSFRAETGFWAEIKHDRKWVLAPAWILLGWASGVWLYATVPLFGVAGALWRARR